MGKELTPNQQQLLETAKALTIQAKEYHRLLIENSKHRKKILKLLREEKITFRQISEHLNISQQYLVKLLNDKKEKK
jgi:predicted transcriptional regulator